MDALIATVIMILGPVFDLLPTDVIELLDVSAYAATLDEMGRSMGAYGRIISIAQMLRAMQIFVSILLPGVLIYKVANWIYKHIPQIGGFGPGSG